MFLGNHTAALVAKWLLNEKILVSHLNFSNNNLQDSGLASLAMAIGLSSTIVFVDLSHNEFSPRCAPSIFQMIAFNQSIIQLKIGSLNKLGKNRLGREGGVALSRSFSQN